MLDLSKAECRCVKPYKSAAEYRLALATGLSIEDAHLLIDLWTDVLDETLDSERDPQVQLSELKAEYYGRTKQASTDQASS
ncbi:hypothetical protein HWB40_gp25 [Streptomyces phage Manuel]|uniref:Uncharacterized protein n=1 Tax=Streptomyces phage Manuel TaxID=2053812 RepID=A0A2H4PR16_9CAUD|nr:hypothetical protein HWB40_gp25 [Streptomyces phage Manuel]ATW69367.1 hypothetical protein SEA_MANUEL_73 [Streptomyces phage Manuel]